MRFRQVALNAYQRSEMYLGMPRGLCMDLQQNVRYSSRLTYRKMFFCLVFGQGLECVDVEENIKRLTGFNLPHCQGKIILPQID